MTSNIPPLSEPQTPPNSPQLAAEGNLGGRKVKVAQPEFGENRVKVKGISWVEIAKKVAVIALTIISAAVVGFLLGGPLGLCIGATAGAAFVATVALAKCILHYINSKNFFRSLPDAGNHKALLPENAPKVGQYFDAKVRLTETAACGLKWKKELIATAEESIELSVNFAGGSVYREVLEIMDARMSLKPNLKTHMIVSVDLLEDEDKQALSTLQAKFGDRFNILITDRHYKLGLDLHTEENHVKMLVVDGKYFVGGGTSIHPRFCREQYDPDQDRDNPTAAAQLLSPASKDSDIVGQSPQIAQAMRDQFFNLYRLWEIQTTKQPHASRYFVLTGVAGVSQAFDEDDGQVKDVRMKVLVSGPEHTGNSAIVRAYKKRILKSKNEIRLANWMFCPPKSIAKALEKAAVLNPKLKRIAHLNGMDDTFSWARFALTHCGRQSYHLVDKVYEYTATHRMYHKKVATFDDTHMIIGSFNLGKKSADYDHEIAFVLKGKEITDLCRSRLKEDKKLAERYVPETNVFKSFFTNTVSYVVARAIENFI